ncbi:MAG: hypothetical protein QXS16_02880 [Pyrobaculum sp.]
MATFTTPCTIAMGVVKGRVVYLEIDGGKRSEDFVGVEVESAEPRVEGDFIKGHLAVASFSSTIVKGVALLKDVYIFDYGGLRPLVKKIVSVKSVKSKEFGAWEHIWNRPLLLTAGSPTVAIGASRAGSLLHINAVPTDVELLKKAWAAASVLQKVGELNLNCTCRIGVMPLEIFIHRGNRYIVAKFYLNTSSRWSKKAFFIMGEGGNVIDRREVDVDEAEIVAYEYIKRL